MLSVFKNVEVECKTVKFASGRNKRVIFPQITAEGGVSECYGCVLECKEWMDGSMVNVLPRNINGLVLFPVKI